MLPRTYLYVPGSQLERFEKAASSGAGAVILDLEDAVAEQHKDRARETVASWLAERTPNGVELWVRVNAGERMEEDVRVCATAGSLTGVIPAKTASAAGLVNLDRLLQRLGSDLFVEPLLESAGAVLRASEIAGGPRVRRLHLGEVDLRADMDIRPGPAELELIWARSVMVAASAAWDLHSPVAPVSEEFRDLDAFRATSEALRRLGFWGRACIHPTQVAVAEEAFRPSEKELAWAGEVVSRLEQSRGATTGPDGRLIDNAARRIAERLLERG